MDILNDPSLTVFTKATHLVGIPEYAQITTEDLAKQAAAAPDAAFADPNGRLFPRFNKAATFLSALYVQAQRQDLPAAAELEARLRKVGAAQGITADLDMVFSTDLSGAGAVKTASAQPLDYAVVTLTDGSEAYPINDVASAKLAYDHFERKYAYLSTPDRRKIAQHITATATSLGCKVAHSLYREAGWAAPADVAFVAAAIEDRASRAPAEFSDRYRQAGGAFATAKLADKLAAAESFVDMLADLDKAAGLHHCYGSLMLSPAATVYGDPVVFTKEASGDCPVPLASRIFSSDAIAGLPKEVYSQALGDELCSQMMDGGKIAAAKVAAVCATLGTTDRRNLEDSIVKFASSDAYHPTDRTDSGLPDVEDDGLYTSDPVVGRRLLVSRG